MGWTEVTRKKERKTDRTDSAGVVTQENTPLTPLETTDRTNDRTTRRRVRAGDGRAFGRASRRIDFAAPTHADAPGRRTGKLVNARISR